MCALQDLCEGNHRWPWGSYKRETGEIRKAFPCHYVITSYHKICAQLNHLPLDKMTAISQTTFSNTFSWMKRFYFDSSFTEVCSQGSNWQYSSIGSDDGLAPTRRQAIIWTIADPIHWRMYAALWGGEGWKNDDPNVTVTSRWALQRLKSPATALSVVCIMSPSWSLIMFQFCIAFSCSV